MKAICQGLRILLPVDGSEHAKRAVRFAGYFGSSLSDAHREISLLRVVTGRYMTDRLPYLDFRAEILKQSDVFKKFKQRHIETNIKPSLEENEQILKETGILSRISQYIVEGDPAQEIIRTAKEKNFNTIVMARRGLSEIMGALLGSVTNKVVLSASGQTVYIVGQHAPSNGRFPVSNILIPIDGSKYSLKGVEHAACLSRNLKDVIRTVTFLRVINLAFYETRLLEGADPEDETKRIFQQAQTLFAKKSGIDGLMNTKVRIGRPAEEIMKEAEEGGYNLIMLGRKGRTALREIILGGVSSTVLQRCLNPTIAVVSTG